MEWGRSSRLAAAVAGAWIACALVNVHAAVVHAASQSLLSDTLWYDADQRELRSVDVQPEVDDSRHRHSRWLAKPDQVRQQNPPAATAGGGGATGFTIGNLLGWGLIALFIGLATWLLWYSLRRLDSAGKRSLAGRPPRQVPGLDWVSQERIEHLPAELRRSGVHLRDEAVRLMADGQFDQAMIALFGHQLLLLDHAALLRLTRGKTNRQYVREALGSERPAGEVLHQTAAAFERSYFGRHPLTADEFAVLWRLNEQLERRLLQAQEAAA